MFIGVNIVILKLEIFFKIYFNLTKISRSRGKVEIKNPTLLVGLKRGIYFIEFN